VSGPLFLLSAGHGLVGSALDAEAGVADPHMSNISRLSGRQKAMYLVALVANLIINVVGLVLLVEGHLLLALVAFGIGIFEVYLILRWSVRHRVRWPFE
jgi:hypothetical protein